MDNVFVFHGIDYKVGTTMIAQSTAEMIAKENKDIKVMLLFLNGRKSDEFIGEKVESIEAIKANIDNKMMGYSDVLRICLQRDNLYLLAGIEKFQNERYFFPETAIRILKEIRESFDIIIVDSGNNIDNGLSMGALQYTAHRFLVLTQQETMLRRYEQFRELYKSLQLDFPLIVINKHLQIDPYDLGYIAKRLEINKKSLFTVNQSNFARQAEIDGKTILHYSENGFEKDVRAIANWIRSSSGHSQVLKPQGRKKWISFI
jgi:MinD-like ATPase involved in chromosome partitioning or flagellar assembly